LLPYPTSSKLVAQGQHSPPLDLLLWNHLVVATFDALILITLLIPYSPYTTHGNKS
jgi:hypothetical protein